MKVVILYNPNSTGNSKKNALDLSKKLKARGCAVKTLKTTHAGHGEELAAAYAKANKEVILISSSGDGGYHEVMNGALASPSQKLIVGVLPSGNANDHATALQTDTFIESIAHAQSTKIDTIRITATVDGKPWVRYAHSYAGIGLTATAAKRLTEDRPNIFSEKWIVLRSLFSFRHTKIKQDGKVRRYSSILFANIGHMSKVLKLSSHSSVRDGKFEVSAIRLRSKLRLIIYFLTAATKGLKKSPSISVFTFETFYKTPIQLDGEVFMIDAKSEVEVRSIKQNLKCVV